MKVVPLTVEEETELRRLHVEGRPRWCLVCITYGAWPCNIARLLATLDAIDKSNGRNRNVGES